MSELTLTHLRVIVEVSRRGSVTAAASALGFTQSAISRQLQGAEAAAGLALFEREPRGMSPTAAGAALLHHAREMLREMAAAETDLERLRGGLHGRLVVGAYPMAHAHVVPRSVALLKRAHRAIDIELVEDASPKLLQKVISGILHAALIAVGDGLPDYDLAEVAVFSMPATEVGIAISAAHPFAGREEILADELEDEVWIVGVGDRGEPQFGAWPTIREPHIAHRARAWPARVGLVAAGLGVSVMPLMAAPALPQGVVWRRVRGGAWDGRRTAAITGPNLASGARAFVEAAHEVLAGMRTAEAFAERPQSHLLDNISSAG